MMVKDSYPRANQHGSASFFPRKLYSCSFDTSQGLICMRKGCGREEKIDPQLCLFFHSIILAFLAGHHCFIKL